MNEWTSSVGSLRPGSWKGLGQGPSRELGPVQGLGPVSSLVFLPCSLGGKGAIAHQSEHVVFAGCGVTAYVSTEVGSRRLGWSWENRDARTRVPGHACQMGRLPGSAGPEKI